MINFDNELFCTKNKFSKLEIIHCCSMAVYIPEYAGPPPSGGTQLIF